LPSSARFERLQSWLSVDVACQVGALLLVMGIVVAAASVGYWGLSGFGDLDPSVIARSTSLSAVLAALGAQSVANGFLWGLLTQDLGQAAKSEDVPAKASLLKH
jgi:hypothetical protein